jgi:hypothetical protein
MALVSTFNPIGNEKLIYEELVQLITRIIVNQQSIGLALNYHTCNFGH